MWSADEDENEGFSGCGENCSFGVDSKQRVVRYRSVVTPICLSMYIRQNLSVLVSHELDKSLLLTDYSNLNSFTQYHIDDCGRITNVEHRRVLLETER